MSASAPPSLPCLLGYTQEQLIELMAQLGQKPFRATQLMEWIWKKRASSFEQMSNIAPALRAQLSECYSLRAGTLVELTESSGSASTQKMLTRMDDGQLVESVIIPAAEGKGGKRSGRITLCVSSQVGCAYGCKFCASGLLGLARDLTTAEILAQIILAEEVAQKRVDNLVFMGMGEPLANMEHLERALELIMDPRALQIGARHITISTSGHVEGLRRLAQLGKPIRLAISLHGASDEVRSKIMPVNRKWPLSELLATLREWNATQKHMLTLEYILIDQVNASLEDARNLIRVARDLHAKVNLIPYNSVEGLSWVRPSEAHCKRFCRELLNAGIPVTMRYEKGHDINAACGQLRLRKKKPE